MLSPQQGGQREVLNLERRIGELLHEKQVTRQHTLFLNKKIEELEADNIRLATEPAEVLDTERRAPTTRTEGELRRLEDERDQALKKLAQWEKRVRLCEELKRKNKKLASERESTQTEVAQLYR